MDNIMAAAMTMEGIFQKGKPYPVDLNDSKDNSKLSNRGEENSIETNDNLEDALRKICVNVC